MKLYSLLFLLLLSATSCAWIKGLERSLIGKEADDSRDQDSVSAEKYNELLARHEELNRRYESLKQDTTPTSSLVEEINRSSPNIRPPTIETVDVFAAPTSSPQPKIIMAKETSSNELSDHLETYNKAMGLRRSKNYSAALKLFQKLEKSAPSVIAVRAKYHMADMLFVQNEFDLSMQAFEQIVTMHSHSVIVLQALKKLVICTGRLNLDSKAEQYRSLLKDIFEEEV